MKSSILDPALRFLLVLGLSGIVGGCQSARGAGLSASLDVDRGDRARPARQETQETGEFAEFEEFEEFQEFEDFDEFGDEESATTVGESEGVFDPLSGYNRLMFGFNDWFFLNVWSPVADGYRAIVPEPARVAVERLFKNLTTPVRFVNSLLQFQIGKAGVELGRVVVNSTLGIGGLFDPADAWFGWTAPSSEDFGQTLGRYGVGHGFPIVLPFLGPSNLRDGLALIPDGFLNPAIYYTSTPQSFALAVGERFNRTSLHIGEYESLRADALDPYTLFRDAYHQNRLKKIEE